jgi:ribosomal-protein-alanine N-acetyltransferase
MLGLKRRVRVETERMTLRLPEHGDWRQWSEVREASAEFLAKWEPVWSTDHLTRRAFTNRVYWAQRAEAQGQALPMLLIRRADNQLLGALTEAILALTHHAFTRLDLSRLEAACLPENLPSRGVLEKCGFKYEGVAQSYLQINGRWRNHVLYANLRGDRRGRTDVG